MGLFEFRTRERRLGHVRHVWITCADCARKVTILIIDCADKVPRIALGETFRSTEHFLESCALPVAWETTSRLFLERFLENRSEANGFIVLVAKGSQKVDLTIDIIVVVVTAIVNN